MCAVLLANPRCWLVPTPCAHVVRLGTSWKGQVYSVYVNPQCSEPTLGQGLCQCVSQLGMSFACAFLLRKSKIKTWQPIRRNICERDWMICSQCVPWVPPCAFRPRSFLSLSSHGIFPCLNKNNHFLSMLANFFFSCVF